MKTLTEFKQAPAGTALSEAISDGELARAEKLIIKYLKKKMRAKMFRMPGVEQYVNSQDMGYGVRFFMTPVKGFDSIRFNWRKERLDSSSVASVDLFGKGKHRFHLSFAPNTSMAKVLPFVVDFIENPKTGDVMFIGESVNLITEEVSGNVLDKIIGFVQNGSDTIKFSKYKFSKELKKMGEKPYTANKLFDALEDIDKAVFIENDGGSEYMILDPEMLKKYYDEIITRIATNAKVSSGATKEKYKADPEIEAMEAQGLERLTFERQIEDMKEAVRLLWARVTNSVFIGGRGGVGKTHNVEEVLNDELGIHDGDGYFKNAGSISASGLYRLLYKHHDSLILFDDSDNVFGDQEARNILKGATDTKLKRKLSWSKKSSDIVPADDFSDEDEEEGKVPSFFTFTGKILFISNLKIDKIDPDGALRTRGLMLTIEPTDKEVYEFMRKIAPNMNLGEGLTLTDSERHEVVDVLENAAGRSPNLRTLDRALKIRAGATISNWQDFVIRYA